MVEYETDVPQFGAVWYLPALALASGLALALVRTARPWRWAASAAAAGHFAFVAVVAALLAALGFDSPLLPLLLVPAIALDLAADRGWPPLPPGLVYVGILWATYVPYVGWRQPGLDLGTADVLAGLVLALAVVGVVFATLDRERRRLPQGLSTGVVAGIVAFCAGAPLALAHDPGQGPGAGTIRVSAQAKG